jgi:hypothetical protein
MMNDGSSYFSNEVEVYVTVECFLTRYLCEIYMGVAKKPFENQTPALPEEMRAFLPLIIGEKRRKCDPNFQLNDLHLESRLLQVD